MSFVFGEGIESDVSVEGWRGLCPHGKREEVRVYVHRCSLVGKCRSV